MKNSILKSSVLMSIVLLTFCTPKKNSLSCATSSSAQTHIQTTYNEPHRYGGWYCPDNLNGFPPVNLANWSNVPVINGRFPTKEETKTEQSLIFVDTEKYPQAKVLDIQMPRLAKFRCFQSKKTELIILIQAFTIDDDSIVGFRYLNGGNGSARLKEVDILNEAEIATLSKSRFVVINQVIKASPDSIWKVLRKPEYTKKLSEAYDQVSPWDKAPNLNYWNIKGGELTSEYANLLFGCFYAQNDYDNHSDKFLLLQNEKNNTTELKIVCGPFGADFKTMESVIQSWSQKVKVTSEKMSH